MSLQDFYTFIQTLEPRIKRNILKDKVIELTRKEGVRTVRTELDTKACRGFYISAKNTESRLVKQCGCNVIVLPRPKINDCWDRFIFVKELMHLFDNELESTGNQESYELLLNDLQTGTITQSPQLISEINCFVIALFALCPEKQRLEYKRQKEQGLIDDFGVATMLRIPKQYIPYLLSARFEGHRADLLKNK